jgi:hypothetical protein
VRSRASILALLIAASCGSAPEPAVNVTASNGAVGTTAPTASGTPPPPTTGAAGAPALPPPLPPLIVAAPFPPSNAPATSPLPPTPATFPPATVPGPSPATVATTPSPAAAAPATFPPAAAPATVPPVAAPATLSPGVAPAPSAPVVIVTSLAGAPRALADGANADTRPRGTLISPLRGASGLGATPELVVRVSCPGVDICPQDLPTTANLLAERIRFVDGAGEATPVVPDEKGTPLPADGGISATQYMQGFTPSRPLAPDVLYAVDLTSDDRAVLTFEDASAEETAAAADTRQAAAAQQIRVFSGSRPLPVEIRLSSPRDVPVAVARLRFSEPVIAGSLVGSVAMNGASGALLPSCPRAPGAIDCADPSSSVLSDVFDLVLATPVPLSELQGGRLSVARIVHGGGRSVGEAATMAGNPLAPTSDALTVSLDASMWLPCGANDDLTCFRGPAARWP